MDTNNFLISIGGIPYSDEELKTLVDQKLKNITLPQWERDIFEFIYDWIDDTETIEVQTSGTTGDSMKYQVSKKAMIISARKTLNFFNLKPRDSALLCLSPKYIAGKLMIVRAFVGELNLMLSEPSGTPLEELNDKIDFAAMVPMQVQKQIQVNHEAFKKVRTLIIGGGEVSLLLKERLQNISTDVWETYGMTETLTHIALKKLNGIDRSDWFTPLPGVKLKKNSNDCLVVEVEGITSQPLITNDIVEFNDKNLFRIKGRADDVINTGGIKIMPVEVEKKIGQWLDRPFAVSSLPDEKLGERVVLVIEGDSFETIELKEKLKELAFFEMPRTILFLKYLPRTESGKVKRGEIRKMKK